ncbi:MAG: diguanylate cyclase domain-containing protein [Methylocystis sp.]|uniref:diguanylate cyclase domain-containing protein n=1 Tax=Methylocystis sp. TaxID=1911079 RepID=UPI003DA57E21
MAARKIHGYPVLILGAGRGGAALLEMFIEDEHVEVLGIVDPSDAAPGILLAKRMGIPVYSHVSQAVPLCQEYPDFIVYNLTHDDAIAEEVSRAFGNKKVTSGPEAKLFWQIVTNLKRIKVELENSQNQLNAIIHHAMDGILTISESGEIQGFNPAAEEIFGYAQDEMIGKPVSILLSSDTQKQYREEIQRYLQSGQRGSVGIRGQEVVATRKNGEQFPMELSASEMEIKEQRFFVAIVRDVTERKLVERKIKHMAHHDYLTGLPNRSLFIDQLEQAIRLAKRRQHKTAVLFLDLDGFKQVNDALGHEAGDQLLKEVAARLKTVIRDSDVAARMGGDEFTFVLNDIGSHENAAAVAQKIIDTLSEKFNLKGRDCRIGGSVGIAVHPDDAADHEALLRKADEAMYVAKKSGKNTYRLFR